MARIDLSKTLEAPIEHVFELLSDHANYSRFPGINRSELLTEGAAERNGVGALRRIKAGPITFEEEITAFERPTRMDYLIRKVNVPAEHHGGRIDLEADGERTHVHWVSTFDMNLSVLSGPAGSLTAATIERGFVRMLDEIERLHIQPAEPAAAM